MMSDQDETLSTSLCLSFLPTSKPNNSQAVVVLKDNHDDDDDDDDDDQGGDPSLTLSLELSGETLRHTTATLAVMEQHAASSDDQYSKTVVKRERGESEEEEEDDGGASCGPTTISTTTTTASRIIRKKLRLNKEQSAFLEDTFKQHTTLNPKQKQVVADRLNLRPRQIEVWFQNRRARTKLKQTEVECEEMKKYCDTLRDENRRLQKEVEYLKGALKLGQLPPSSISSSSLYMNMHLTTTPAICPSCCQRIGSGSGSGSGSGVPITPALGPIFYPSFPNSSAAC